MKRTEPERIEWLKTQAHIERLRFRADCDTAWAAQQHKTSSSILWRLGRWYVQHKFGQSSDFWGSLLNVGAGHPNPSGFGKRIGTLGGFAAAVVAMLWRNRNTLRQVKRSAGILGWCARQCLVRKKVLLPLAIVLAGVGLFAWLRHAKTRKSD